MHIRVKRLELDSPVIEFTHYNSRLFIVFIDLTTCTMCNQVLSDFIFGHPARCVHGMNAGLVDKRWPIMHHFTLTITANLVSH